MAIRSDLCGYWKQQSASPSRYVEHFVTQMQVGKVGQRLTKMSENWWTDPVIDRGSPIEYSQALFLLINSLVGHYDVLN